MILELSAYEILDEPRINIGPLSVIWPQEVAIKKWLERQGMDTEREIIQYESPESDHIVFRGYRK